MKRSDPHPPEDDLMALALGEADDAARAQTQAHIDGCEACRREYVGLIEALGTMAYAVASQRPPARLRADILDAAAREPRTARARAVTAPRPLRWAAWRRPSGWSQWAPRLAVGAAALAAIVFAVLVFTNPAGSTRVIALHGVSGSVIVTNHTAVLESDKFVSLPHGRVYEMWVIHDGAARPAGLFRTAAGPVPLTTPVAPGDTVAVTTEPADGTSKPTTAPVAVAAI